MRDEIYQKVFEKLLSEFSSMGGGAVGGVSTPLGTGPKAGAKGENIYKGSTATDKEHRSKGKKKKTYTRSVQWYLKNGGEKGRKRSLKEIHNLIFINKLDEVKTARIMDLKKSEIIAYLNFLKGHTTENIDFSVTEKIAGQSMTVGIKGGNRGNTIYCAAKDSLIDMKGDIFHPRFAKSSGTSSLVKKAFIEKFRKLSKDEEIVLGMEIVINDKRKPDFIAYHVPPEKTIAAIFSIKPEGSFTKSDVDNISGKYWNRKYRANSVLEILLPENIPLRPDVNIDDAIINQIDELIQEVENTEVSPGKGPDFPKKKHIKNYIAPKIRSLVKSMFPSSNINASSPIEGLAVNMTSGDESLFFKVPSEDFDKLQKIQAQITAEFRVNRNNTTRVRAQGFIEQLNNPVTTNNFARNVFKLVKHLNEAQTLPLNYRTFFSPRKFKSFCSLLLSGLQNQNSTDIEAAVRLFSKQLFISQGTEQFNCAESEALESFIGQNNLI